MRKYKIHEKAGHALHTPIVIHSLPRWLRLVSRLTHEHCYFRVSVFTPRNYSRQTKERRPRLDGRRRGSGRHLAEEEELHGET